MTRAEVYLEFHAQLLELEKRAPILSLKPSHFKFKNEGKMEDGSPCFQAQKCLPFSFFFQLQCLQTFQDTSSSFFAIQLSQKVNMAGQFLVIFFTICVQGFILQYTTPSECYYHVAEKRGYTITILW